MIGLLAAALGATGYGAATVLESLAVAPEGTHAPRRRWLFGLGLTLDGVAWLASLVAFRHLPLAVAQSLLASSVVVTAVLAHWAVRRRVPRRVWAAGLLFAVGTGLLAAAAGPGTHVVVTSALLTTTGFVLAAVAALTVPVARGGSSLLLSVLAGVAFSGTAVCGRLLDPASPLALTALLDATALVAFSVLGIVLLAKALVRGSAASASAVMWTTELVLGLVSGVALLGDRLHPGAVPIAAAAALVATLGCGVIVGAERRTATSAKGSLPVGLSLSVATGSASHGGENGCTR